MEEINDQSEIIYVPDYRRDICYWCKNYLTKETHIAYDLGTRLPVCKDCIDKAIEYLPEARRKDYFFYESSQMQFNLDG